MAKNPELERAIAELAYSAFAKKAPALMDNRDAVHGFQLLDSNEDETQAVGVFIIKVGSVRMAVPAFYLGGRLKGLDLLYVQGQDLFVPFEESWIHYLVSSQPQSLGAGTANKPAELGLSTPSFTGMFTPQGMGKMGSFRPADEIFEPEEVAAISRDMLVAADNILKSGSADLTKRILDKHPELGLRLYNELEKSAALQEIFEDAFGATRADGYRALLPETTRMYPRKRAAALPEVEIYDAYTPGIEKLSDAEKTRVFNGETIVRDYRKTAREAVQLNPSVQTRAIDNSDSYLVLDDKGATLPVYVEKNPYLIFARVHGTVPALVVDPINGTSTFQAAQDITALEIFSGEHTKDKADKAKLKFVDLGSMKKGTKYALLIDGRLTEPFEYCDRMNANGEVCHYCNSESAWRISDAAKRKGTETDTYNPNIASSMSDTTVSLDCVSNPKNTGLQPASSDGIPYSDSVIREDLTGDVTRVILSDTERSVLVPKGTQAIELPGDEELRLAKPDQIMEALINGFNLEELTLKRDGGDIRIVSDSGTFSGGEKQAFTHLLSKVGLCESSAREAIEKITKGPAVCQFYAKRAFSIEAYREPVAAYDSTYKANVLTPDVQHLEVTDDQYARPEDIDPTLTEDNGLLTRLTTSLSKSMNDDTSVMDTSALSGLLATHDVTSLVDEFIPDMLKGLDRIGRTLFLMYWNYDQFLEKFGKADVNELEDNLRSLFSQFGSQILFLRRQTTVADPERAALSITPEG